MKYLFKADVASSSLRDAVDVSSQYHTDETPDILLRMASYNRDLRGLRGNVTSTYTKSWRTKVKRRPSILDALGIFLEVFETGAHKFSGITFPGSSWGSRDRLGLSGIIMPGWSMSHKTLSDFVPLDYDLDVGGLGVDFLQKEADLYLAADSLFVFAEGFSKLMAESREIFWYAPLPNIWNDPPGGNFPGGLSHYTLSYPVLQCTNDEIRYVVVIHAYTWQAGGPDLWQYSETSYGATITRDKDNPWAISVKTSTGPGRSSNAYGHNQQHDTHVLNVLWGDWYLPIDVTVKTTLRDASFEIADFGVQNPLSIMRCAPALYHTQSRAFYKLLGQVSENFESLIESPRFLPVVYNVLKDSSNIIPKSAHLPFLARLRTVLKLVCGVYLAYIFAIAPSLKSARDAWERFLTDVRNSPGEGQIQFEGYAADLSSLPDRLQSYVRAVRPGEIFSYKITFRSTLTPNLDPAHASSVLEALLADASRLGVEPDPTLLYQAMPFTFVFDMFLPMSSLMRDAYQRFKLIRTRGVTVGHSVSLSVTYPDGLTAHVYLRSDAGSMFIDPPLDSWLVAPGASAPVLVPLALVVLL